MNWGRVQFDASTYMLCEGTGDSEVECVDVAIDDASEAESDDDAQSCSDGSSPDCADSHLDVDADGGRFDFHGRDYDNVGGCFSTRDDRGENYGDSDEEDGVVDQYGGGRIAAVGPPEDPGREANQDEMENSRGDRKSDRQFWEACLAS